MRSFLISSKKYSGSVEVVYNDGALLRIDFAQANLTSLQLTGLKEMIPAKYEHFEARMMGVGAIVVEKDYEVSFDDYWKKVKKKVNRKRCEALWLRMGKVAQVQAVVALPMYYKYLQRTGRLEADPETYLRNEYYTTEWQKL